MESEELTSRRSYQLRCWPGQAAAPGEPLVSRFILQDVADEQRRRSFENIEQVMDFLLDELLNPPE